MVKTWIFGILAVVALGFVFNDPQGKAEANAVFSAVSESVDPYLRETLSSGTHEEVATKTEDVADWMAQTGKDFGISVNLETE